MLNDVYCLSVATISLPLFVLIPGYVIGWAINLYSFRQRRGFTRVLIGIVLSIAVLPSVTYYLTRLTDLDLTIAAYGITWVIFIWILIRERKRLHFPKDRWVRLAVLFTLIWIGAAFLSLPDIQIGQRVYPNSISYDHQTRIALTDAIFRTGIPPVNPHIYPGQPLYVSYFYFWNVFPAMLSRLTAGFIDPRMAFYASTVWAGIALRALACLYLRFQSPEQKQGIGPRSVAAVGLFLVTGLDVIFAALSIYYYQMKTSFITEWWNGNSQITAWAGASLWVPHHVGGLIAGITGILLFRSIFHAQSTGKRLVVVVLTALSLCSVAGLSVYVGFIFAIFWAVYVICSIIHKEWRQQIPWLVVVGVFAVILTVPFFNDMVTNRDSFSTGGGFMFFEVRPFGFLSGLFTGWPQSLVNAINLLLLPLNYFLELGFFLLIGVLYIQAAVKDKSLLFYHHGVEILLLLTSVLICSFFRSAIISNNDIGWRGFMPAQFILLIWGANSLVTICGRWFGNAPALIPIKPSILTTRVLYGLLVVGLISTLFDLSNLRLFPVFADLRAIDGATPAEISMEQGERIYAIRKAYRFIDQEYPRTVIVQNNPLVEAALQTQGLYGYRQTAAAGEMYSFIYGDSPKVYQSISPPIQEIFNNPNLSFLDVQDICSHARIDVLLVKDVDPVWRESNSWVWMDPPILHNDYVRVFDCGKD